MRLGRVGLGVVVAAQVGAGSPSYHPLHTTITELTWTSGSGTLEASIRGFADDINAAAGRGAGAVAVSDSALARYAAASLVVIGKTGRAVELGWCGARRAGDLIWLCLRGPAPAGLSGGQVQARMMFELYHDQVNIVQVSDGSRRQTLLFAQGDGSKALR
jgi:hypothetical protein